MGLIKQLQFGEDVFDLDIPDEPSREEGQAAFDELLDKYPGDPLVMLVYEYNLRLETMLIFLSAINEHRLKHQKEEFELTLDLKNHNKRVTGWYYHNKHKQ